MPKAKSIYICSNCANETSQWVGQCPSCGQWNTLQEDLKITTGPKDSSLNTYFSFEASGKPGKSKSIKISEVMAKSPKRVPTGIYEFDRVLGSGFVDGQVVLLSGDPGIGKSTLLMQITNSLKTKILYICGEESIDQVKIRAKRMEISTDSLYLFQDNQLEHILDEAVSITGLGLIIVDSIQTLFSSQIPSIAGSVVQVRGCTMFLTSFAKNHNIPVILVGHVTKEGVVAGPKVLEHIVDTILYLEGEHQHMFRILRTTKNRFGPVSEAGIFEMTETGMIEVKNPSELFLSESSAASSGSCVVSVMEGQRPLFYEVQSLAVKTNFGYPKRTTSGYNVNRLQVLLAILEKRTGHSLQNFDIYLNVAGGFKLTENAADLGVCLAIISSILDKPLKAGTVAFGECGLNGEVRKVPHAQNRIKEAKKMGFKNIISPDNCKTIKEAISKAF